MGSDDRTRIEVCGEDRKRVLLCRNDRTRIRTCRGDQTIAGDTLLATPTIHSGINCNFYFEETVCGRSGSGNLVAVDQLLPGLFTGGPGEIFHRPTPPCTSILMCDDVPRDPCRSDPSGADPHFCGLLNLAQSSQRQPFCCSPTGVFAGGELIQVIWTGTCQLFITKNMQYFPGIEIEYERVFHNCCGYRCGNNHTLTYSALEEYDAHPNCFYNLFPEENPCVVGNPVIPVGTLTVVATLTDPMGIDQPIEVMDFLQPSSPSASRNVRMDYALNWAASGRIEPFGPNTRGFGGVTMFSNGGECVLNSGQWLLEKHIQAEYTPYERRCFNDECERCMNWDDWQCGQTPPFPIQTSIEMDVVAARVRFS